jgi:hypothetical protein
VSDGADGGSSGDRAPAKTADGFLVLLMTPHERFRTELARCIRKSHTGVLVRPDRYTLAPAPVVGVSLRRTADGVLGPVVWLGPLHDPTERACLCDWLRDGGLLCAPVPRPLRRRILIDRHPASVTDPPSAC